MSEYKLSMVINMIRSFTSCFWILAVTAACATVCPASSEKVHDCNYSDYFNDFKVENESYYHSIFWPEGAFPPSEPYLFYKSIGQDRGLGFGDYNGKPAELVYSFPSEKKQRTISGELRVDVSYFYADSPKLSFYVSSDGINWSIPKMLITGTNVIPLESIRGICYIKFSGYEARIDNLHVNLYSYPADFIVVPGSDYPTLQSAIKDANDGDVIEVAPGTYKGSGNTDIDFLGKAITIYSSQGAEKTFIDCENTHRGFYFHTYEDSNSVLRGFTIQNGKQTNSNGGGIYCEDSSPSIIDCVIQNCTAKFGAGIGLANASPYIADCVIQNCSTTQSGGFGAGMALLASDPIIVNTKILNNTLSDNSRGAGIYCSYGDVLLANCEIRKNRNTSGVLKGGGIYAEGAYTNIELKNCVIADNTAQSGAGIYTDSIEINVYDVNHAQDATACRVLLTNCTIANNNGGGIYSTESRTYIRNSIIWGNTSQIVTENSVYLSILYSDVQDLGPDVGYGNIKEKPLFAGTDDYHLLSNVGRFSPSTKTWVIDAVSSLCIDAGAPGDAIIAESYLNGKRINMGAYGGTDQASRSVTPNILHVSKNGSNATGLSKETAFRTIQKAVDAAHEGDVIMIWPDGIYTEDVKLAGAIRKLTIQSADEAAEIRAPSSTGYAFSFLSGQDSVCVLRNLIITNSVTAIYCNSASPTLTNLVIANNTFGIEGYGGAAPTIKNCIFWNNTIDMSSYDKDLRDKVSYSRFNGSLRQIDKERGNIDYNPSFVNYSASNGDYHLLSYSPCIDAGDKDMSPAREPKPNGGRINMGAYGGTPYATKSY